MRSLAVALCVSALAAAATSAGAAECRGRSDALGTERVISVDPTEHPRVGVMQYDESLPLADKEVVLTFDDGPIPPYTSRVLDTLAAECVKATFFMVGRQAHAFPDWVRRVYNEGHTVASHSLYLFEVGATKRGRDGDAAWYLPVSYTHLTLPTILRV